MSAVQTAVFRDIARHLESIAQSLEKLANPPIFVDPDGYREKLPGDENEPIEGLACPNCGADNASVEITTQNPKRMFCQNCDTAWNNARPVGKTETPICPECSDELVHRNDAHGRLLPLECFGCGYTEATPYQVGNDCPGCGIPAGLGHEPQCLGLPLPPN